MSVIIIYFCLLQNQRLLLAALWKPMLWLSSANTSKPEFETEIKYFYSYLRLGSECRIFYVLKSFSEKSKFQFCLVAGGD